MSNTQANIFSIQTQVWPLVLVRVGIGYWFWYFGSRKLTGMLDPTNKRLLSQMTNIVKDLPPGWYQNLAADYIAPNAVFFANLVMFGELAVAIALILGFMTRPALLGAIFMNLNYQLYSGLKTGPSTYANLIFLMAEVCLLFTLVGRSFGLDYFLHKKFPRLRFLF